MTDRRHYGVAMGFEASEGRFGGLDTLQLIDRSSGAGAVIARRGATLLRWFPAVGAGEPADVIDGYRDEAELVAQAGVRSGVMTPFSNRIAGGRYTFDGEHHDLLPGVPDPDRLIFHGFLRLLDCDATVDIDGDTARVRLTSTAVRPGAFPGYPFAVDLAATFTLSPSALTLEITGRNVGDRPAPYGCGWHPYFRLGPAPVDRLELRVPARTSIRTDDALIPLPGERAHQPVEQDERPTYEVSRPVGDAVIDAAYADLEYDPDGRARTELRDPESGRALTIWQESGLMHVFTGDTLDRDQRASIALEPVELMTDAFNRPDCAEAVVLPPGSERNFRCGVDAT